MNVVRSWLAAAAPLRVRAWVAVHAATPSLILLAALALLAPLTATASVHTLFGPAPIDVPLRLLVPAVSAGLIGVALGNDNAEIDRAAPRRLALPRIGWLLALTSLALAGAAALAATGGTDSAAVARNTLLMTGLAAATAAHTRADAAWLPPVLYAAACFGFGHGVPGPDGTPPHAWALALRDDLGTADVAAATVIFALGAASYAWRGAR